MDRFNIASAKSLVRKMEEKNSPKISFQDKRSSIESTSNTAANGDKGDADGDKMGENKIFKEKVKKMQRDNALGQVLCNVGQDCFQSIKKSRVDLYK